MHVYLYQCDLCAASSLMKFVWVQWKFILCSENWWFAFCKSTYIWDTGRQIVDILEMVLQRKRKTQENLISVVDV